MATQLQIRRGTTAQMTAFTGAEGELAVNTSTDTVHVHDGSTAGGFALAKADGSNIGTYAGSFTTLAASGAVTLSSTLAVTGTVTADGLTVANTSVIAGDFDGGTAATYIRLQDDTDNFLFGSNNSLGNFLIKNETADALRLSVANTGDISFYNSAGTSQSFFWDASAESLGIGTSSPQLPLHVTGGFPTAVIERDAGAGGAAGLVFTNSTTNGVYVSGSDTTYTVGHVTDYEGSPSYSERARLDVSGNLLVGGTTYEGSTTSNASSAYIASTGFISANVTNDFGMQVNRTGTDGTLFNFRKNGADVGSTGVQSGRLTVGSNSAAGVRFDGTQLVPMNGASISDNTITLGDSGFRFKDLHLSGTANVGNLLNITDGVTSGFLTTTSGLMQFGTSTSAPIVFYTGNAERVRLHTSGKTVASASISFDFIHYFQQTNANGYMLGVDTAGSALAFFYKNGSTGVGSITTNGTSTSFNETSDKRAKENIVDSPSASADIDSIQVRSFDWIETGEHQKYGTIAQELQSIAPYAVYEPENSEHMMGVDYSKLVPMMLKEIQSLRTRVQALENN